MLRARNSGLVRRPSAVGRTVGGLDGERIWGLGLALPVTLVPLLFPDGHLPSRRWRPVAWLIGIGIAAFVIGSVFAPGVLDESDPPMINPVGFGGASDRPSSKRCAQAGSSRSF